jgi:hypothetical protein
MQSTNTNRTIFEKKLLSKPFNSNIWLFYLYIEINNGYFNHAKKILYRMILCLKKRIHLVQKLHFFDIIVLSKALKLNFFDNLSNLSWCNKLFYKNLHLFLIMDKFNQVLYLLKNKYKYNFNSQIFLKVFELEIKRGKIENSIFLFENFFADKKHSVILRLFNNICNRVMNFLNKKRKLVITKNSFFILNKIKNKFFIAQLNYRILKKWKFRYIEQFYNRINNFFFLKKPIYTILMVDLLHIDNIEKKHNFSIIINVKKRLTHIVRPNCYFDLVKHSLFLIFSNMEYDIRLNPKVGSLVFLIKIIVKDQFQLIKRFKITEIYKNFFFFDTLFYINNLLENNLDTIKKLFIYLFSTFFDQRLYFYCYIFFNFRNLFNLKKKLFYKKKKMLGKIDKYLNLKFWIKKKILKIFLNKNIFYFLIFCNCLSNNQ